MGVSTVLALALALFLTLSPVSVEASSKVAVRAVTGKRSDFLAIALVEMRCPSQFVKVRLGVSGISVQIGHILFLLSSRLPLFPFLGAASPLSSTYFNISCGVYYASGFSNSLSKPSHHHLWGMLPAIGLPVSRGKLGFKLCRPQQGRPACETLLQLGLLRPVEKCGVSKILLGSSIQARMCERARCMVLGLRKYPQRSSRSLMTFPFLRAMVPRVLSPKCTRK